MYVYVYVANINYLENQFIERCTRYLNEQYKDFPSDFIRYLF